MQNAMLPPQSQRHTCTPGTSASGHAHPVGLFLPAVPPRLRRGAWPLAGAARRTPGLPMSLDTAPRLEY